MLDQDLQRCDYNLRECFLFVRQALGRSVSDAVCMARAHRILELIERYAAHRDQTPARRAAAKPFSQWLADTADLIKECQKDGQ